MDATSSIKSKLVMDKSFKGVLEKLSNSNISLPTSSTLVEGNIDLDST